MPTRDEWPKQPIGQRLQRMGATADEIATGIRDKSEAELSRRPGPKDWAAKEIVCHLRDIEELMILRFHTMHAMDDPNVLVVGAPPVNLAQWRIGGEVPWPLDADRWAEERQYLRNDATSALAAFRRRRSEVFALLRTLTPDEWQRGSIHPTLGRVTFENWTAAIASHDDTHLAQLERALAGRA